MTTSISIVVLIIISIRISTRINLIEKRKGKATFYSHKEEEREQQLITIELLTFEPFFFKRLCSLFNQIK
jgi:hypothetical protein